MSTAQIITTIAGPAILGAKANRPSAWWMRLQISQPDPTADWFHAYPIAGGALLVQNAEVVREATPEELAHAMRAGNPAAASIRALVA